MSWWRPKKKELTRRELAARRRVDNESQTENSVDVAAYRRSRTLSERRHTDESSPRQGAWDLRKRRRKLVARLAIVLAAAACVLGLLTQLTATITVETPAGLGKNPEYAAVLEGYLAERPIERLRFMLNTARLHEYFLEKAPEVQSVEVHGGTQLAHSILRLTFRQPVAQWSAGDTVYFVDTTGVTFEKNHFAEPKIVVSDQSGVPAEAGQEVINQRFLSFLGQAVALFDKHGLTVTEAILPPDTVRQVEFRLDGKPYVVRMTIDRTAEAQVEEALKAISFLDGRGSTPSYIDVRVDQRVFYK